MSEIFIKYLKPRCRMGIDTFERSTEYLYDCDGDGECEAEILKNGIFKYVPSTREAYKNVVNKPCTYCEKATHIKSFKTSKFNFETDEGAVKCSIAMSKRCIWGYESKERCRAFGTCSYITRTGHMRGCETWNCTKFEEVTKENPRREDIL